MPDDIMTFYKVLLAICSGAAAIWGFVKIIKEIRKPHEELERQVTDIVKDVKDLQEEMGKTQKKSQEMDEKLLEAIDKLDKKIDSMSDKISQESKHTSALMAQSLVAVGNHLISGNDIKKIEAANKDLLTYLIEK